VGSAIDQAVSRWLLTAAARDQVGFVVDKVALGQANLHSTSCATVTFTYHLGLVQ
jgi:hypothetical protein